MDKNGLPGNLIEARLAAIFGPAWANHPHKQAIRDGVPARLRQADYQEVGQRVVILPEAERRQRRAAAGSFFMNEFGVTEAQAAALRDMHLPSGWEAFSAAALRKCLPQLEAGARFGALLAGPEWELWRAENFPGRDQPTGEVLARLPSPGQGTPAQREEQIRIASLRNPTVVRTQNELRKVVNNLIGAFGKPDLIRIELARDVGRSKKDREEKQAADRNLAKRRKEAEKHLRENDIEPSRSDIEKWLLWQECNKFDPYSGRAICFEDLFRHGEFEVEHIWPRSASFDDSFGNKTLCLKALNNRKANRTPFAAFGNDGPAWDEKKKRVWGLVHDGKMSRGKAKRFCSELAMDDDFKRRQLNDTGYAARQAVTFLRRLWPDIGSAAPVTVQTVSGRVTAQLRRLWGLNNILSEDGEKTRADHRHHAIDALVVACAHPGMTQDLSRYWQAKDDPVAPKPPPLDPPWRDIRADAAAWKEKILVSHRVRKKVSGPLHDEMPLGYTKHDVAKGGKTLGVYVKRMQVEKLSLDTLRIADVREISRSAKFVVRDEAIRRRLLANLESSGKKPVQAYPPYPRVSADGPEIRKARVLTVQQKELMVGVANGYVDPANNHHIAVYRLASGKICFEVVSLFEGSRRLARHEPIVRRDGPQGARFVMSLAAGDSIGIPACANGGVSYTKLRVVAGIWASGQVVIRPLSDAVGAEVTQPTISALLRDGYKKVSIDPIGRARPAND